MSEREEQPPPQRGDEERDASGVVWIVLGQHYENGPYYSKTRRVRKGSLAARVIFGEERGK